ncbi:MAG: class I SAM-dependent methyltransferase [Candidatus Pacebacteria bacterium]|nr:class I SAM-dependent methyltransferase [Candidatus Paceibacterota bacterium]
MNIFQKLKELNLPLGEYVLIGSTPLAARGIREAGDLDMAVTPKLFKQLIESKKYQKVEKYGKTFLEGNDVDIAPQLNWDAYPTTTEEAIKTADIINGYPFLSIAETIKFKKALGRDKDFRDIKLLEDYQKNMTVWDKIYQDYKNGGEEYATLKKGLIPEFLEFINNHDFKLKKVLDIGCGNGKYLVFLKTLGFEVSGIDSSPTAVEMSREALGENSSILCSNMYEYSAPQSSYDLIISIAAIHHGLKKEVKKAINSIYKALTVGGRFFITLPDNEGSSHWTVLVDHKEIEPGTRIPLSGPEKDLPHSSFTKNEIKEMFSDFTNINMELLANRGRWIITGEK